MYKCIPYTGSTMKIDVRKIICLVTAALMLFVFTGCLEIEDDPAKEAYASSEKSSAVFSKQTKSYLAMW